MVLRITDVRLTAIKHEEMGPESPLKLRNRVTQNNLANHAQLDVCPVPLTSILQKQCWRSSFERFHGFSAPAWCRQTTPQDQVVRALLASSKVLRCRVYIQKVAPRSNSGAVLADAARQGRWQCKGEPQTSSCTTRMYHHDVTSCRIVLLF